MSCKGTIMHQFTDHTLTSQKTCKTLLAFIKHCSGPVNNTQSFPWLVLSLHSIVLQVCIITRNSIEKEKKIEKKISLTLENLNITSNIQILVSISITCQKLSTVVPYLKKVFFVGVTDC